MGVHASSAPMRVRLPIRLRAAKGIARLATRRYRVPYWIAASPVPMRRMSGSGSVQNTTTRGSVTRSAATTLTFTARSMSSYRPPPYRCETRLIVPPAMPPPSMYVMVQYGTP